MGMGCGIYGSGGAHLPVIVKLLLLRWRIPSVAVKQLLHPFVDGEEEVGRVAELGVALSRIVLKTLCVFGWHEVPLL